MTLRGVGRLAVLTALLLCVPVASRGQNPSARPSLCTIHHPSDLNIEWTCLRLRRGHTLLRLFGDRWVDVARFNRIDRRHAVPGVDLKVPVRLDDIRGFTAMPSEYAPAADDAKLIVIDLSEQFLGAYERGRLVFSTPVTTGAQGHETPTGEFRMTAADPARQSSLYVIEGTSTPYPMGYTLRFHVDPEGVAFWIHGRDVPGYPASHGCIGLYDERMQAKHYGQPTDPVLDDARKLYAWVLGVPADSAGFRPLRDGPRVHITGSTPRSGSLRRPGALERPDARGCSPEHVGENAPEK